MILIRTTALMIGAASAGLIANAVRRDGVSLFAWQPSTVCETTAAALEVTPEQAQSICADPGTLVIDVRSHEHFERGHIPQARHLPCRQQRLEDQTFEELSGAKIILVYGTSTEEARAVADSLAQRNLPVQVLVGGYPGWEAAGLACSSGPCEGCVGTHDE
jgi:rhodanese-related sulfurtransferase